MIIRELHRKKFLQSLLSCLRFFFIQLLRWTIYEANTIDHFSSESPTRPLHDHFISNKLVNKRWALFNCVFHWTGKKSYTVNVKKECIFLPRDLLISGIGSENRNDGVFFKKCLNVLKKNWKNYISRNLGVHISLRQLRETYWGSSRIPPLSGGTI